MNEEAKTDTAAQVVTGPEPAEAEPNKKLEQETPPDPDKCEQGVYRVAVTFKCSCGYATGNTSRAALQAAVNNGSIRAKCTSCGKWLFLLPAQTMVMQAGPAPGQIVRPNRLQRRAARAMARTKGGLIVPR